MIFVVMGKKKMKLIDADELEYMQIGTNAYVRAEDILSAKTVDAVQIVRCKNCEHHEGYGGFIYCERHSMTVSPDYYCGDGKDG